MHFGMSPGCFVREESISLLYQVHLEVTYNIHLSIHLFDSELKRALTELYLGSEELTVFGIP